MKDRIRKYMDYKNISAGELSSLLEVQRSNISHILNGRNKPGALFIEKLLISFPDLNARWLLTGEGDMLEISQSKKDDKEKRKKEPVVEEKVKEKTVEEEPGEEVEKREPVPPLPTILKKEKPVSRVVLLFEDGTFTDFERK